MQFEGGDARELLPVVDGTSLVDLAAEFERASKYEPSGKYAGLVVDYYRFGDLRTYLTGSRAEWPGERVPLLGCDCGEWGCWPLVARVSHDAQVIRWDTFRQPHRPGRDYGGFGPFVFDATSYADAAEAAQRLVSGD